MSSNDLLMYKDFYESTKCSEAIQLISFNCGLLRITELEDLDVKNSQAVGYGSFGCVSFIQPLKHSDRRLLHLPDTTMAIKALFSFKRQEKANENRQMVRFDREYIIPLLYPCPFIVNVYNYFHGPVMAELFPSAMDLKQMTDTTVYMTMEKCDQTLEFWIDKSPEGIRLRNEHLEHEALLILVQILLGLEHLEAHNVTHMDIKIDNILVCSTPRSNTGQLITGTQVLISDFGCALTEHHFVPTPENSFPNGNWINLAPELVAPADPTRLDVSKTDIWAVGCVFYELLEGVHPLADNVEYDATLDVSLSRVFRVNPLKQPWSDQLRLICFRLLDQDPSSRPTAATARAMVESLLWVPEELQSFPIRPEHIEWIRQSRSECLTSFDRNQPTTLEQILKLNFFSKVTPESLIFYSKSKKTTKSRR